MTSPSQRATPTLRRRCSCIGVFLALWITAPEQAQGTPSRLLTVSQVGMTRKPEILRIRTQEEFNAVLKKDRAIVFFWVRWSMYVGASEKLVQQWMQKYAPSAPVYRVDADQPYVQQWLAGQRRDDLGTTGGGEVAWFRRGVIVAEQMCPYQGRPGDLQRQTQRAF